MAEWVDGDSGRADAEGAERLGLKGREVVEGDESEGDVGRAPSRADLGGDVSPDQSRVLWLMSSPGSVTNAAAVPPDSVKGVTASPWPGTPKSACLIATAR
ncbi:hypothetical protein [Streptomyces goshikiensis]|uniref:hypothetical protein n=1 Tax=Streptomyces goshikiensis TaxID=1942 RepID=UPI003720FEE4